MLGSIAEYPESTIFYTLLVFICVFLARVAEESNNPKPLVASVLLLVASSALRSPAVGIDTGSYASAYLVQIPGYFEPGFKWLIQILQPFQSLPVFFGLIALVIYGAIFARFWQLRDYVSVSLAVCIYMLVLFSASWNGLRSCLVAAIMFYAAGFIEKRRFVPFFVLLGVCCTIHYSSVAFILLLLGTPNWMSGADKKQRVFMMIGFPLLILAGAGAMMWMVSQGLFNRYGEEYGGEASTERIGLSWLLFIVLLFASWMMLGAEPKESDTLSRSRTNLVYLTLSIVLLFSGLVWFGGGRLSSYFMMYATLVLARFWRVSRQYRYGLFYRFGVGVYCVYAFLQVLISNGQALLPYIVG